MDLAVAAVSEPNVERRVLTIPLAERVVHCSLPLLKELCRVLQHRVAADECGILLSEYKILRSAYLDEPSSTISPLSISTIKQAKRTANLKLHSHFANNGESREEVIRCLHSIRYYLYAERLEAWMKSEGRIDIEPFTFRNSVSKGARESFQYFCDRLSIPKPDAKIGCLQPVLVPELGFGMDCTWKGENRFLIALHGGVLLSDLGETKPLFKNASPRTHLLRLLRCTGPVDLKQAFLEHPIHVRDGKTKIVQLFPECAANAPHWNITVPLSCSDKTVRVFVRSSDLLQKRPRVYIVGKESGHIIQYVDLLSENGTLTARVTRSSDATATQIRRQIDEYQIDKEKHFLLYERRPVTTSLTKEGKTQKNVAFLRSLYIPVDYPFQEVDIAVFRTGDRLAVGLHTPGVDPRYSRPFRTFIVGENYSLIQVPVNSVWKSNTETLRAHIVKIFSNLRKVIEQGEDSELVKLVKRDPIGLHFILSSEFISDTTCLDLIARTKDIPQSRTSSLEASVDTFISLRAALDIGLVFLLMAEHIGRKEDALQVLGTYHSLKFARTANGKSSLETLRFYASNNFNKTVQRLLKERHPVVREVAADFLASYNPSPAK